MQGKMMAVLCLGFAAGLAFAIACAEMSGLPGVDTAHAADTTAERCTVPDGREPFGGQDADSVLEARDQGRQSASSDRSTARIRRPARRGYARGRCIHRRRGGRCGCIRRLGTRSPRPRRGRAPRPARRRFPLDRLAKARLEAAGGHHVRTASRPVSAHGARGQQGLRLTTPRCGPRRNAARIAR